MKQNIFIHFGLLLLLTSLFASCSSDYTPKPTGYPYLNMENHEYKPFDFIGFECKIPTQMKIEEGDATVRETWFNWVYPSLHAQIYCTYLPITKSNFKQVEEDNFKLFQRYMSKADSFQESAFENREEKVFGLVYRMRGNVVSPVQFVLTDSATAFFRGVLCFDNVPNQDSIAPVLEYINEDIQVIIESFRWKK